MVEGPSPHLNIELMRRFQQTISTKDNSKTGQELRSAEELLLRAETLTAEKERRAAEQKAKVEARKKKQETLAREQYLESLADKKDKFH